jgi:hypothetical protein
LLLAISFFVFLFILVFFLGSFLLFIPPYVTIES